MSLKKGKAKRRRHPVAKIKGNWSSSDDAKLIRFVLQLPSYAQLSEAQVCIALWLIAQLI